MKKKNKIIWGAITAVSIGSLVVGSSLACVQFNASKKDDNAAKTSTKNITNLSASDDNVNTSNNINFNDHAYMQTLNQSITTNPQGSSWTKQDALMFTNSKINDLVNIYGVTYVLRWNLIQNLNYSLSKYISSISQQQFSVSITNFNYNIMNAKNNDNLQNYSCSITLNVQFKVTSKADGATLTFSNTYTYNDVVINTNIINNGQNAYAYLVLTNSLANTLVPNNVSYCNNAKISNNWTNNDFVNLQTINWLPINSNTTITTANYQGMLADSCARSFNNGTNQTYTQQTKFINLINSQQLYTFNIGFNFGQLNDVVIEVQGQKTNNDGLYMFNYNNQVTLQVNFVDSTIISGGGNVYQWMQESVSGSNNTGITIANATSNTYQFNCYQSYKYYLQVTLPNGKTINSNTITIDVNTSSLSIENLSPNAKLNSNIYATQYGTQVILSANHAWQNMTGVDYTWEVYDDSTKNFQPIQGAPNSSTYAFTATKNAVYKLLVTAIAGNFTITSTNSYAVTVKNSTIAISALNANNKPYSNDQAIPYGSSVQLQLDDYSEWQAVSGLTYTWYKVIDSTALESVQSTSTYSPYSVNSLINNVTYELEITNPNNPSFTTLTATINLGISNTQLSIGLTKKSLANPDVTTSGNGNVNVVYGNTVTLQIDSSYWNEITNPQSKNFNPTYFCQWYKYVENPINLKWSPQIIAGANKNTYSTNVAGIYQLKIENLTNPNFDLSPSNETTIVVTHDDCTIQTNFGTKYTNSIKYGQNLTLSLEKNSYWDTNSNDLIYTWYKQGDSNFKWNGTSYTITSAKNSDAGTYYLVITNKNNPNFKIISNSIVVNVGSPKLIIDIKDNSKSYNSNQLQNAYQYNYGQEVTFQIDTNSNASSQDIANSSNVFSLQWGTVSNNEFKSFGQTSFEHYDSANNSLVSNGLLTTYALFLSDLYKNESKIGITYRLVMSENGGKTITAASNTITILPNSDTTNLPLQEGTVYSVNQNYQVIYSNSANLQIKPGTYWANLAKTSNSLITYTWTNEKGMIISSQPQADSITSPNYLAHVLNSAQYTLTIKCKLPNFKLVPTIDSFQLSSTLNITPTSNTFNLNIKTTYGKIDSDDLTQNSITATYGTYICFDVLNLAQYEIYNNSNYKFQYTWSYAYNYSNGILNWKSLANDTSLLALIAQQNVQIKLAISAQQLINGKWANVQGFSLQSTPFSLSVVNTNITVSVFNGLQTWSATPTTSPLQNSGGNNYFLNYAKSYTLGLDDYWNNPNTQTSVNGFNEIYENGLTYTWTCQGKTIQSSSTNDFTTFNPWYQINSFGSSAIYTLTVSGTLKSSGWSTNLPHPTNIPLPGVQTNAQSQGIFALNLTTKLVLNVQSNAVSIEGNLESGAVTMVNAATYDVAYGDIPSVKVQTNYFISNSNDYRFNWYLNDDVNTPVMSGTGSDAINYTLPNRLFTSGTTIQLEIIPLKNGEPTPGAKPIWSNIITFNVINVNVNIVGSVGTKGTLGYQSSSTQVTANYGQPTTLAPAMSTSSNPNYWGDLSSIKANKSYKGIIYTWYQLSPNGGQPQPVSTNPILVLYPTVDELQYTLIITDPDISNSFKITSTTDITVNVKNLQIDIKANNYQPTYGDQVTLSLTNSYWTNVNYQWINVATNQVVASGYDTNNPEYIFNAKETATYKLLINWTENGNPFSLTSNSVQINVKDSVLGLTITGTNPDDSNVASPSQNAEGNYVVNCWYGAKLAFQPSGYWANLSNATYQWYCITDNGKTKNIIGNKKVSPSLYALDANASYYLILTYNGVAIQSGIISFNLSNQNVAINASYDDNTSTSINNPITVPFGVPFTLNVSGAWANSTIPSNYIYTWYYGSDTNNANGVKLGTGTSITVLSNDIKYYDGSSLPAGNNTYSYYCIITNKDWNVTNSQPQVTATTTPTVNVNNVIPQISVESLSTSSLMSPQTGTTNYITNYGEQIQLNINNYGWDASSQSLNWNNYGSLKVNWYVKSGDYTYELKQDANDAFINFYSLTNDVSYYAIVTGSLTNGTTFTFTSQTVTFSVQETNLALKAVSGSVDANGNSNSIVSGPNTACIVKYGSMQIITPSSYWVNYFNANSSITLNWQYNNGNGTWTALNNNLNQTSNQCQYAQFFTNTFDSSDSLYLANGSINGASGGAYKLSATSTSISQIIPNGNDSTETATFSIDTAQPVIIEIVGQTLGISLTGNSNNVTLTNANAYSCLYGTAANVTINGGKVDWSNPDFLNNNSQYAWGDSNITLKYAWYYGTSVNNMALQSSITSNSYAINGQAGFYQLVIIATMPGEIYNAPITIFSIKSNIINVSVIANAIEIQDSNGQTGVCNYSFGQNPKLQLNPNNYWATHGNSAYQWYCSTTPEWNETDIYNETTNPSGTIFELPASPFDSNSLPQKNIYNQATNSGSLYGPNSLNLYGSGDGQSIECTACYAIKTKIYYWLELKSNSNWVLGTQSLISSPIVINPIQNEVTIGSHNNSLSSSDWYNPDANYIYNYGEKVIMSIYSNMTSLPSSGIVYNWQVYTGDNIYSYDNPDNNTAQTVYYNPSGFYDIIAGDESSITYDTNPNAPTYWFNALNKGIYRLKVTINHVSIYSNPIYIKVTNNNLSLESQGVDFKQGKFITNQEQFLPVTIGTNSTVKLIPNQFWWNVFTNKYGTTGPFSQSYYNWTVNWTDSSIEKAIGDATNQTYIGSYSGNFQLNSNGNLSDWNLNWTESVFNPTTNNQYQYENENFSSPSNESISWTNDGIISISQVLSNFSFTLTITPKDNCDEYIPFKSYWTNTNEVTPSSTSFAITSSTTITPTNNYVGLVGKALCDYSLNGINSSYGSFVSNGINVPFLTKFELKIPSDLTNNYDNLTSNEIDDLLWNTVIKNDGEINGQKIYSVDLYKVTTTTVGLNDEPLITYTKVSNYPESADSLWTSPIISESQSYAIGIDILSLKTGTSLYKFYSSIFTVNCFARNVLTIPVGISKSSTVNTYSMSYLELINNPIEFKTTNNWIYLENSKDVSSVKMLIYYSAINDTDYEDYNLISSINGEWLTNSNLSTWTNPFAPIYQSGFYYVELQFYSGSQIFTLYSNILQILTEFNSSFHSSANDSFSISSDIKQKQNSFNTSIVAKNSVYINNFNSFVNWETSTFASNETNSSSNSNPYALLRTITPTDLGGVSYYGNYFKDSNGIKLTIPDNSNIPLYTAINFAIQYEPSGASSWETYGKAVTFDASLLPSGSNYWGIITNYWLMQNANKTGELSTGINGFNPFAWTIGNQNYQWRVLAKVELAYNGVNYIYTAPNSIPNALGNQFIFTSPTWQFDLNSSNLTLNVANLNDSTINPTISSATLIYELNPSDKYSLKFASTPNISWNTPIDDESINPYSEGNTMYLTAPILLNVQILFEQVGATSFSQTNASWTNPIWSKTNPYTIYQTLFNDWKNNKLVNYSLSNVLNHLSDMSLNSGFYQVQFTLLDTSDTWIMNAQNNVDSSKWTFNKFDTATFSSNIIYVINSTNVNASEVVSSYDNQNVFPNRFLKM